LPLSVFALAAARPAEDRGLLPPFWVDVLLGPEGLRGRGPVPVEEGVSLEVAQGRGCCLASVRVREARALGREAFQGATARAYRHLAAALRDGPAPHPVRLWNHIPGIHEPMGAGQDRYMVFNAGRFEALSEWLGGQDTFDTRVASASGVGHEGQDLVLHCLSSSQPGQAVHNPRQIAPYRYSRKYGPLPPCFARATILQPLSGSPRLLVGGTASIVGEESVHLNDLARQTRETLMNLAVLVHAAAGEPAERIEDPTVALCCYRNVRIYYPDPARLQELGELLVSAFPDADSVEWIHAGLCRPELLVEIEGVAEDF
jgi:enamine deaminase RidA (YjgF/YER057c/UK114 family)